MKNSHPLQRLYLRLHRRVFRRRLREQKRFERFYIVSIGNLSAGGTGKTPLVRRLAERVLKHSPLVVLRGYGGRAGKEGVLVSDGRSVLTDRLQAGDEALLLAGLPGLRVAAGADRARLIERYGDPSRIVFLDDAFQNPTVYRDFDLVLIDASVPLEKLRVFPLGRFREGLDALERADAVLLTRVAESSPENRAALEREVAAYLPLEKIFCSRHEPQGLLPEPPAGARFGAFCGIGNPESFFRTLAEKGLEIRERRVFPDHHAFRPREIRKLLETAERENLRWITTEKDAVRLKDGPEGKKLLQMTHVLEIRMRILDDREEEFFRTVFGGRF